MVKVSVVIPLYNAEKYIDRCLKSIINQTLNDIEIIVINDGSTDNSLTLVKKYEEQDKRIKVYDQKNIGAALTRNRGIFLSSGDYITFIDSDDYLKKDYIETLYKNIKKYDVCISGYIKKLEKSEKYFYPTFTSWDIFKYSATCGKMYRKKFIVDKKISYQKRLIMEDVYFNINCYLKDAKYNTVDYCGYYYFLNNDSVTKKSKDKEEELKYAISLFEEINVKTLNKKISLYEQNMFINFYIIHFVYILNMCCRNSTKEYILAMLEKFYLFLNSIDKSWYKVKSPTKESFKNKVAIYSIKKIYKFKLSKVFSFLFSFLFNKK